MIKAKVESQKAKVEVNKQYWQRQQLDKGEEVEDTNTRSATPPFDICERTFHFAVRIVHLCSGLGERPGPSRRLGDQLLRAGTSIGANVEEGRAGQSRADFISKHAIALKEARESSYWLRLIGATVLPNTEEVRVLHDEAEQLKRILGAIVARAAENA